jgi:hypothetical protein
MIDTAELDDWAADLADFAADIDKQAKGIVSKGSLNIKNEARENAPRGPHVPSYYRSITYDVRTGSGWVEGETGPRAGGPQWGLGSLFEYGNPYSAPQPHLEPALDHEEPRFYEAAEQMLGRLEERYR